MPPGPLKTERFRRAKTGRAGEPGPTPPPPAALLASEKVGRVPRPDGGGRRETRIPDGKEPAVGVDGKTLTDECGERPWREADVEERPDGDAKEALDVLDAFECVWW